MMYSDVHRIGTGQFNEFVEQLSRATDDTERVHLIRQYSNLGFFYCRQLAVGFPLSVNVDVSVASTSLRA